METHGWTKENYTTTGDERGIDLPTFFMRLHHSNTRGLPVCLSVSPITPDWRRLLMVHVRALPGFMHLGTWARVVTHYHTGNSYHISLCFVSELPRDGAMAYERIRHRYDGMRGVLSVEVTNSAANLTNVSTLSHMILNDPDIALVHNSGFYSTRELHVSL